MWLPGLLDCSSKGPVFLLIHLNVKLEAAVGLCCWLDRFVFYGWWVFFWGNTRWRKAAAEEWTLDPPSHDYFIQFKIIHTVQNNSLYLTLVPRNHKYPKILRFCSKILNLIVSSDLLSYVILDIFVLEQFLAGLFIPQVGAAQVEPSVWPGPLPDSKVLFFSH